MNRAAETFLLLSAALVPGAVTLLAPKPAPATRPGPDSTVAALIEQVSAFVDSLSDELKAKGAFAFDDAERTNWHFVPNRYPGVELGMLDLDQRRAVHGILRTALSGRGYFETVDIFALETVLRDAAKAAGQAFEHRDAERYSVAVFGEPSEDGSWGFRLQGHHVSLNLTFAGGRLVGATPRFLGANPHELRQGPRAGERVLGHYEDRARALLASLNANQRAQAILEGKVPADILAAPGADLSVLGEPKGLPAAAMDPAQRELLASLLELHPTALCDDWSAAWKASHGVHALRDVYFSWIGSAEKGQAHYWRIHAPEYVIEYDNIQNGANHPHTVWHDLKNGFGADVLKRHHQAEHGTKR